MEKNASGAGVALAGADPIDAILEGGRLNDPDMGDPPEIGAVEINKGPFRGDFTVSICFPPLRYTTGSIGRRAVAEELAEALIVGHSLPPLV